MFSLSRCDICNLSSTHTEREVWMFVRSSQEFWITGCEVDDSGLSWHLKVSAWRLGSILILNSWIYPQTPCSMYVTIWACLYGTHAAKMWVMRLWLLEPTNLRGEAECLGLFCIACVSNVSSVALCGYYPLLEQWFGFHTVLCMECQSKQYQPFCRTYLGWSASVTFTVPLTMGTKLACPSVKEATPSLR